MPTEASPSYMAMIQYVPAGSGVRVTGTSTGPTVNVVAGVDATSRSGSPAVHVAASRVMRIRVRVQSASVSQAIHGLLLHAPAAAPSPGAGSLQVPALLAQQTTAPGRPHVDRAAQRIMRSAVPIRQPAFRNVLP